MLNCTIQYTRHSLPAIFPRHVTYAITKASLSSSSTVIMCSCQARANRKPALQGSANQGLSLWGGSRGTTQAVGRITRGGKDTSNMISLGLLLVGLVLVQAGHHNHVLSEHFIDKINAANSTWKAGRNFHPETSHNFLRTLMGVHPMAHKHLPPPKSALLGEASFLFLVSKSRVFLIKRWRRITGEL